MANEKRVEVRADGLVRVQGVPVCRRVVQGGEVRLEVVPRERNSNLAARLGGQPATVSLTEFVQAITEGVTDGAE